MNQKDLLAIVYVDPASLVEAPYNPRTMSPENYLRLKRGIREFGPAPLTVRRKDRLIIGGHQTRRACLELGLAEVPVIFRDDLDDDQRAAALNVLLNNREAQGEWDMRKLSDLLSELDANGFDATLTGFAEHRLEELLTWTPDSAYQPNLEPLTGRRAVTGDDVEAAQGAANGRFRQGQRELRDAMCPQCGHEFYVDSE